MSLVLRLPSLTPRRTAEKYMSIVVVYLKPNVQKNKTRLMRQDQDGGFNRLPRNSTSCTESKCGKLVA